MVTIENISIIILSIFYFYEQITVNFSREIYIKPRFWVVSAYMLYSAGTFFLFLFIGTVASNQQQNIYILNYAFLVIKSILLSIAMLMKNEPGIRKKFTLT